MESHNYTHESPEYVQFFLDGLQHMQPFTVIFRKQDGTQRKLTGTLDLNSTTRKQNVAIMCEDGLWKSFNINRVLWIGTYDMEYSADYTRQWYDTSGELE